MKLLFGLMAISAFGADFYVSPQGSDSGPGTLEKPFASLARARDVVREQKQRRPNKDYVVQLRGGVHRFTETLVFALQDSAADGRTITYEAYPGETPVLSAGAPITGWKREGKLWVADLPAGVRNFVTLYDKSGRLQRARGAGFSPTRDYKNVNGLDTNTLAFPAGAIRNWPNLSDVEIFVRPNFGWLVNMLPLESVDEAAGLARTSVAATHQMIKVRWGPRDINAKGSVWVENALDVLDEPGEWALNTNTRKIYLWPRTEKPEAIEASQLTELIRVEGKIDYDGPRDTPVRGITFRGLSFTRGDRFRWEKERLGWGLQHDWEMFDRPTALLRLRGSERISIENCRFFDSGGTGVRMDLHAQHNRVVDSVFERMGGAGILLAGYGPGTKDVNRHNEVLRNHIHHVGEILWHAPAVFVWQSGENRVGNNLVHDLHYSGIVVSGRIAWNREGRGQCSKTIRWKEIDAVLGREAALGARPEWRVREPFLHGRNNIVERNDIHHVMNTLWDGNGIYVSGTGKNNIVRENFVHDNLNYNMCEAIRCDGDQHETTLERNVIFRNAGTGSGIAINGVNHIINNFIVDQRAGFAHRALISLQASPVDGSIIQRNVLFATTPGTKIYFQKGLDGPDPHLRETKADRNLYWNTLDPTWAEQHFATERPHGIETNSTFADPMFIDPEQGDFRFRPGSAAEKLGIQPLDMRRVGLRR